MNVVMPATTSVRTSVPFSFRRNHRSNNVRQPLRSARHAPCVQPPLRIRLVANVILIFKMIIRINWRIFLLDNLRNTYGKSAYPAAFICVRAANMYFARKVLTDSRQWVY